LFFLGVADLHENGCPRSFFDLILMDYREFHFGNSQSETGASFLSEFHLGPKLLCRTLSFQQVFRAQGTLFENLMHDFPRRILYRRNGDGTLTARVEGNGTEKAKPQEFHYHPLPKPTRLGRLMRVLINKLKE
jgi:hypothetical protein